MFFGARGFSLPPNGTSIGSARRCIHRHPDPQTVKLMCNVYTCIQQQAAPMRCGPKPNATLGLVSGTACISICAATIAVITTASVVAVPPLTPLIRNRVSRRDCRRPDQNKPELDCRVWRSLSAAFFISRRLSIPERSAILPSAFCPSGRLSHAGTVLERPALTKCKRFSRDSYGQFSYTK